MSDDDYDPAPDDEEYKAMVAEVFGHSPRAGAIVAAAFVEDTLASAIRSKFRKLSKEDDKSVFKGMAAPLSTFSAKIEIGYAMSLYSLGVREDLKAIKSVRNTFAHHTNARDFDYPDVMEECARLNYPARKASIEGAPEPTDPFARFHATVGLLFLGLGFVALNSPMAETLLSYPRRHAEPAPSQRKAKIRPSRGAPG